MGIDASSKNTILVLGANAGQVDLIRHMKKMGWKVVSCAHRYGEPGQFCSDHFELLDVSDIEAVTEFARRINPDLIYSISSDIAITTVTKVSETLTKPHFFNSDLIDLLNRKQRLREHLNTQGLGPVDYLEIRKLTDAAYWSIFPCVVKPCDSQGQRGFRRIDDKAKLENAITDALAFSPTSTAILEEYLDGVEISCNVLISNNQYLFEILSERLVHSGDLAGIPQGHLIPCVNVDKKYQSEALKLVHDTVASLDITNGCLYFQMKVTSKGVRIIEIAPRLDGCHMWRLIKAATGNDLIASTVRTLVGNPCYDEPAKVGGQINYELVFQQSPPDTVFKLEDYPIPDDVIYHEFRYSDGDVIKPINGKLEVVGYYVRILQKGEIQKYMGEVKS